MKRVLLVLCLMLTMAVSAVAKDNDDQPVSALDSIVKSGVFKVGLDPGYMPFEMRDKKGELIGFDIDLAKDMAKSMGVKLEIVTTAWDGIIPALLTGKFDLIMGGMTVTQLRNLRVNFADPYIVVGQTIIINKKVADKVKSYKDLNDPKYTVCAKLGTTGDIAISKYMPNAKHRQYETEAEGMMEVVNGRVDAFVYDLPPNAIFASKHKERVVHLEEPFTFEPLAFAVRRGDYDFVNWINNYLQQIKGDGKYQVIYNKWFESADWVEKVQ
ncbi:extracellular solute-binding protein family 3 [Denitrovibrio acetiphilus DSM 12809]|uniref:Extracellular solute-binding protein family 3 n=1 Tax=Denitrovibrio acetiphilus (strain DSM 12809 / NBRC 114555 / N2460) TaxID=522772 RepID=D4H8W2_DENA2|nr:transporter substrate-binding domain-containing protein [Denitrovibrio acetiphilus]ADD68461.1 extracellular solute-binding protein family 3 [Denitrovibrio acetiphilus DSM 12809]